jgi:hypothetical protein
MASPQSKKNGANDFNPDDFVAKADVDDLTKRIEKLESAQKMMNLEEEFKGEKLYQKIKDAIEKSKDIEKAIREVIWDTVKGKVWVGLIALIGVIVTDLVIRAIPNILKAIGGN